MKNQNNQRWQTLLLAAIAIIFLLGAFSSVFAQAGSGAKFGARDPRTCDDASAPRTGAMTAALAAKYAACKAESAGDYLYLAENVKVTQIAAARRYNPNEDINVPNIDVKSPIYEIRGGYTRYQCDPINLDKTNTNRNCTRREQPKAKGLCYRDTFGDWHCALVDATSDISEENVPPPGGATAEAVAAAKKAAGNDGETTNAAAKNGGNRDENGVLKPDFLAMADWFEVVRIEYPKPPEKYIYIYLKLKAEKTPTEFRMEFRDKDGILLQDKEVSSVLNIPGPGDAAIGETVKVRVFTLDENVLKQAATAKVVRIPR